jgi:hypothetical protein
MTAERVIANIYKSIADRVASQKSAQKQLLEKRPTFAGQGNTIKTLGGSEVPILAKDFRLSATRPGEPLGYSGSALYNKPYYEPAVDNPSTFNGVEQIDVVIDEPEDRDILLVYQAGYRFQVLQFLHPEVDYTLTLAPTELGIVETGEQLTLTIADTDLVDAADLVPLSISIVIRRLA